MIAGRSAEAACLLVLLTVITAVRLLILFNINIHWDEFHFLAQVYEYMRGDLVSPLQTFHVHLFTPLTLLDGGEIRQILVGRLFMFALSVATLGCWWCILRRRVSAEAALFGVLLAATVPEVLVHGSSFRSDPIIAFLFAASITVLSRRSGPAVSGALMGLALVLNLKAALFLALLWSWWALAERRPRVWEGAVHLLTLTTSAGALFAFHRASLLRPFGVSLPGRLSEVLIGFIGPGDKPGINTLLHSLAVNPPFWIVVLSALVVHVRRREAWLLPAAAGVALLFVYRNSWPYFLPLVVYPLMSAAARGGEGLRALRGGRIGIGLAVCASLTCFAAAASSHWADETVNQRALLAAIHRMFPLPVPYIDRAGMVPSFPRAGLFLSSWEVERYRRNGKPLYGAIISGKRPQFMLATSPLLEFDSADKPLSLLDDDRRALAESYLHFGGVLYLAGRRLPDLAAGELGGFSISVPGGYRLRSEAEVRIDQAIVPDGAVLHLEVGDHLLRCEAGCRGASLIFHTEGVSPTQIPNRAGLYRY